MKLNLFGRRVEIIRTKGKWKAFYLGSEGKKRLAEDFMIPVHIDEDELLDYLKDLLHEWSTPLNNTIEKL